MNIFKEMIIYSFTVAMIRAVASKVPISVKKAVTSRFSVHTRDRARAVKLYGLPALMQLHDPHYFVHIPKAAGTSVKKCLRDNEIPTVVITHRTYLDNYKLPPEFIETENPNAFTVVRNPFTRLASAYFFLQNGGVHPFDAAYYEEHLSQYDSFEDFVLSGLGSSEDRDRLLAQMHLIPQTKFIVNDNGDFCVPQRNILRFEHLERDLEEYLSRRGHPFEGLPWRNRTKRRFDYWNLYQNGDGSVRSDLVDVVTDCYKEDFELLGYSKEVKRD